MEEIDLSFNPDDPMPPSIEDDDNDPEGDNFFLERLLHDDLIPLPDTLDFLNVVRVFLPFFTYPVTSLLCLSSGSEDTIFDPGISNYHFSSFKPDLSHRCGTFKKFNTHRSHLNGSPMEILLHLAASQPMLKSSYKAEDGVIISIPPLVGGVADVVVKIKGTGIVTPPNWPAAEYWIRGVLPHGSTTQDI
nr:hypothetical protein [Tanacetum cinerariifolium]